MTALVKFLPYTPPEQWWAKTTVRDLPEEDRWILLGSEWNSEHGYTHEFYHYLDTPCLLWNGWSNGKGHGKFKLCGKTLYLHRHSFSLANATTLDTDDVIDHLCRRRACWNPFHLENVTMKVNTNRGIGAQHQFRRREEYDSGSLARCA
jgi:hypothetical protein